MSPLISRRQALKATACGFGYLALAGMAAPRTVAAANPLTAKAAHFRPKAKRVIFLFMQGGPSHVDTFDYKPILEEQDGKMLNFDDARVIAKTGQRGSSQRVLKSPWKFAKHGQCGHWVSELFPEMARHVDDLCFIHSMQTEGVAHGPATLFLHCGSTNFTRPSMGAWINYGLGSENENLPGFVTIGPSMGNGGPRNFGSAFLPPVFQGTPVGRIGMPVTETGIRNLGDASRLPSAQRRQFELIQKVNAEQLKRHPGDQELEAIINSYELGWRLQSNAPDVLNIAWASPTRPL